MGYIVHLPKSVIGQLRSGSILSDLSQAVEELICNSLDAGAKKICVYVDLASFYVRVEDDGSGVTRDDLLLIGERHATSKLHDMVDLESGVKTLGFRGEALSSLSDIGIVEIITRVRGSPNTYKKILKGSKKLSLGLYGEQRNPGTTVVVRELFHNLPVRRKVTQASPKKVLQGVKERTVRLALIHPDVCFTVIDLERQENLVCTKSYSSSLDILCEFFGEHLRPELQELHYAKKSLKMAGFISREKSRFSSKAIQFLYLNGRFVHKTPIHKLINTLFCHNNCGHEVGNPLEAGMQSAASKQLYPMFLLNLHCPLSWYDITLEVTKTSAEFKDWKYVLLFVTEALGMSWNRLTRNLDEGAEKYLTKCNVMEFKKLNPRKRKPWQHVDPTYHPRCIDTPKPKDDYGVLVSGLQNAKGNDQGGKSLQDLIFDTPKRTRGPRKRKVYGSAQKESSNSDLSTFSWSLQPCRVLTEKKMGAREDQNQHRLGGSADFWCEEDSFQKLWSERSGGLSLHKDSLKGIVGSEIQDVASIKEFVCRDESYLTLADVSGIDTSNPIMELGSQDSYPRLRDLSFEERVNHFESPLRRENLLGFGEEATSAMVEFMQTPPGLKRSFSGCSLGVRRCLYNLDVKSSYTNNFFCHSERQTVSNLELKSVYTDRDEVWTPKKGALAIDFPAHGFYRDSREEFGQECHLLSLRNMHSFLEHEPSLSPQCKERDIFDSSSCLPTSSTGVFNEVAPTHAANKIAVSDKGAKASNKKPLKQSIAKKLLEAPPNTCLQRALSAPPFYRPPLKHAASDGLSTLDGFRELKDGREFQKGRKRLDKAEGFSRTDSRECFQKEKQLAKPLKDRHQESTAVAFECNSASEKRGLQEAAKPQFEDIQNISPAKRIDGDCIKSKWRDTICDDMVTKDRMPDTALQLYKDWKNPCIRNVEPNVLDLSSGILGPSNKHLLPESISKEGLQKTQVLQQMDNKFIATVAERVLVVIDQHAADERVRLEQLRKEVLEEKQHLSALLDYPQELSISLGEQQLLHTYKAQVEEWGWRFKIPAEQKNNNGRRHGPAHYGNTVALLTGVPNILGESLANVKYLSEYLRQLASTDGTSTPPPAVLRLLASKACRGAIMFGDHLLRSECQQLVEGLKKTALSFQCAHGRPTLVPIVNLEALHMRLGKQSCRRRLAGEADTAEMGHRNPWHGLQWHRPTLKRAMERLKQAEEM